MKGKKILAAVLLFSIISLNIVGTYADKADELKDKKKDVNVQIENKKEEIKKFEKQSNEVSNQIEELDKKVSEASNQLEIVKKELETLNSDIKITVKELTEAEKNIKDNQEIFNKRIRTMYKNGNTGYIEVLLSSNDIKDFLSRKDMLKYIAEHDKELIEYMKNQKETIDSKKTKLESQRASVEVSKTKIESRRQDLDRATREKEILMSELEKDIKLAEKEYDKLNQYAKSIESQILDLQKDTGDYSGGAMSWPVPGYSRISSPYGYRIHPVYKTKKMHTGIDVPAPSGVDVKAASSGIVIHSGMLGGYGKVIMIDHGGGIVTLYAHNSSLTVSNGQNVNQGDTIAKIGTTGVSTGPHLHFEVRKNGKYQDPIPWVKGN